jgi:hypothetical protein
MRQNRRMPTTALSLRHNNAGSCTEIKMHMQLEISGYALDGDDGRMKGSDKCLKAGFKAS